MLSPKEIMESEEYQLDRQATAFKKAGDWDGAIAALRKRKALLGVRNGLGLEVTTTALCVVDESTKAIKLLVVDGQTMVMPGK